MIPTALAEQGQFDEYPVGMIDDAVPAHLVGEPRGDFLIQGGELASLAGGSKPGCICSSLERRGGGPHAGVHRREAPLDGIGKLAHLVEGSAILACRRSGRVVDQEHDGASWIVLQSRRQECLRDQRRIFLVRGYEDRHGRYDGHPKRIDLRVTRRLARRDPSRIAVARRKIREAAGHEHGDQNHVREGGCAHDMLVLRQRYVDDPEHVQHSHRPCTQCYGDGRQGDDW